MKNLTKREVMEVRLLVRHRIDFCYDEQRQHKDASYANEERRLRKILAKLEEVR